MFWIDPFLLFGFGLIVALLAKHFFYGEREAVWIHGSSAVMLLVFLFVSVGMFCNLELHGRFAQPFYDMVEAPGATGTAFMLNGGLFEILPIDATLADVPPKWMFACIWMFILYPAYLYLGVVVGRLWFGRKPWHLGMRGSIELYDSDNIKLK